MNVARDEDLLMEDAIATVEVNGEVDSDLNPTHLPTFQPPPYNGFSISPEISRVLPTNAMVSNAMLNAFARSPPPVHPAELNGHVRQEAVERSRQLITVKEPKYLPLPYATSQTGLVYDTRMRFHAEKTSDTDLHPEDPRRILHVFLELMEAGLVDDPASPVPSSDYVLGRIPTRFATREEICAVHSQRHYDWVLSLVDWSDERLSEEARDLDSVYLNRNTPMCARLAAGGAIEACRAVMNKQVKNSFAVIRPPGHHAEHDNPMGFCFFNNVPIAAKACQKEYGDACRKILILDWDVHHGNGVQDAFYDDPNVLYISLHVHQDGAMYPRGLEKDHLHCGKGAGEGKNINIPWKHMGMGDGDYMYAFQQVVMPIAQDFDPDLVIVSAGFDAAEGDLLGGCHVSPAGFAHMTHMLMSLADGKVVVCMEGGYNLRSISVSALAVTRTLMGEYPDRLTSTQPSPSGVETVQIVLRQQGKFWPCLYSKDPSQRLRKLQGERMHDLIREWQAYTMFTRYDMSPLFIARSKISRSFEDEVLATPNINEQRPLLLIFHDPPELIASPDPVTQKLEAHNTWVVSGSHTFLLGDPLTVSETDSVKSYVEWAVERGFGVIDVNIPKHLTDLEDEQEHADSDVREVREKEALQLATYLWENYIEVSDATHLFVLGVGAAYTSIIELIKANEKEMIEERKITKVFFFVGEQALHSCRSVTGDERLANWYHENSSVYVAKSHHIWDITSKKPKRRFGTLIPSPYDGIQDMLVEHKDDVTRQMEDAAGDWQSPKTPSSSEDELAADHGAVMRMSSPTSPAKLPR